MTIKICLAIVAMMSVAACSGMVAPQNEGSSPTGSVNKNSQTKSGDEGGEIGTTAGETEAGETEGGETEGGEEDTVKSLGTISDESSTVSGLAMKSGYMLDTGSGGVSLTLMSTETPETSFKKITGYEECKKKGETTTAADYKSISIYFSKSYLPTPPDGYKVDANGYPKEDDNEIKDPADTNSGILSANLSDSKTPTSPNAVKTGTIKFTAGKRPAKEGDAVEVTLDLTFADGKTYKGKLVSKVVKSPDNSGVTAPPCADDEYAPAIYAD